MKYYDPSGYSKVDANDNKKALQSIVDEINERGGATAEERTILNGWADEYGVPKDSMGLESQKQLPGPTSSSGVEPRAHVPSSEGGSKASWYKADGSMNYPPNNGAVSGTEINMSLKPGDTLGRYGNIGDKSNFVIQTGADASKLSLPPNTDPAIYQEFEVIKEIPNTIQAEIVAWGDSAGGGLQYELPMPILKLIKEG